MGVEDPLKGVYKLHRVALMIHEIEEAVLFCEVGAICLDECLAGSDPLEQMLRVRPPGASSGSSTSKDAHCCKTAVAHGGSRAGVCSLPRVGSLTIWSSESAAPQLR